MKEPIVFHNVSPETFDKLVAQLQAAKGTTVEVSPASLPGPNSPGGVRNLSAVGHGVHTSGSYDTKNGDLSVTVISTPFWLPEQLVVNSIEDFIEKAQPKVAAIPRVEPAAKTAE